MGSCFIWQRTAEPPSFCPAVPSFLEFKQNTDCSSIEKQVLWVLMRNNCYSATTSTRDTDYWITGTKTKVSTEDHDTVATLQSHHVQLSSCVLFPARCRYSNLRINFRKVSALQRAAQSAPFLCIWKKSTSKVTQRETKKVGKVLRANKSSTGRANKESCINQSLGSCSYRFYYEKQ